MARFDWSATRTMWIRGLGSEDAREKEAAWRWFMDRRRPGVIEIARGRGLSEADAEAVANDVEAALFKRVSEGKFVYDGTRSFNGYLATMARNRATDVLRERGGGPRQMPDEFDVEERVRRGWDEEDERRWRALEQAIEEMEKGEKGARDLAVWRRRHLEDRPVAEVAREFQMSPGAVYQACYRVNERLRRCAGAGEPDE